MYLGKLCEIGPATALYDRPAHPYTRALLAAVPEPDPDLPLAEGAIAGDLPSPLNPPSGCRFRTRCPLATDRCAREEPELREVAPEQFAACHFV
jgi:peptide/nickel transport system ATP-binding protein